MMGVSIQLRKTHQQKAIREIRRKVHVCQEYANNGEYAEAHMAEKMAMRHALYCIAMYQPPDPHKIAEVALKTVDIEFPRYYT